VKPDFFTENNNSMELNENSKQNQAKCKDQLVGPVAFEKMKKYRKL
jgi:hypothetical protein